MFGITRQIQKQDLIDTKIKTVDLKEEAKCRYCNRKGHGAKPILSVKKEKCLAFDKTCHKCGSIGHFAGMKACRAKSVKVESVKVQYEKEDKGQIKQKKENRSKG